MNVTRKKYTHFDSLNKRIPKNGIIIGNGKDCDRYLHVLAVA